ncbi:hypothetical protein [Paenibacillus flagellatus]|uniref:Uncharacterized protein n=1 Tax=Paenibacillus flagellatus TaxID=2211139 RepID=A0A2V5KA78_9BACL|nr:hypothetical protein [Paenibacillus flagellatus]PYI56495.1 hypothetical protein DLM86_05850 [Paenibacillus flagellatus]
MYIALAVFAGLLGLFVTGAAVFTAWAYYASRKSGAAAPEGEPNRPDAAGGPEGPPASWFLRWTVADYAALFLFGFGVVFLLADLTGLSADREQYQYPPYHYAYLLCGFVFSFMGMLFTIVRLAMVIRLAGRASSPGHHAYKPHQAQQAE